MHTTEPKPQGAIRRIAAAAKLALLAVLTIAPLRAAVPRGHAGEPTWSELKEALRAADAGLQIARVDESDLAAGVVYRVKHGHTEADRATSDRRAEFINRAHALFTSGGPLTGNEYGWFWVNGPDGSPFSELQSANLNDAAGKRKATSESIKQAVGKWPMGAVRAFLCAAVMDKREGPKPPVVEEALKEYLNQRCQTLPLGEWPRATEAERRELKPIEVAELEELSHLAFETKLESCQRGILRLCLASQWLSDQVPHTKVLDFARILSKETDLSEEYFGEIFDSLSQSELFWNDENFFETWDGTTFEQSAKEISRSIGDIREILKTLIIGPITPGTAEGATHEAHGSSIKRIKEVIEKSRVVTDAGSLTEVIQAFRKNNENEKETDKNFTATAENIINAINWLNDSRTKRNQSDIEKYGTWTDRVAWSISTLAVGRACERLAEQQYNGSGFTFDYDGKENQRKSLNCPEEFELEEALRRVHTTLDSQGKRELAFTLFSHANRTYRELFGNENKDSDLQLAEVVDVFSPTPPTDNRPPHNGLEALSSKKLELGWSQVGTASLVQFELLASQKLPALETVCRLGMMRTRSQIARLKSGMDAFAPGAIGASAHFDGGDAEGGGSYLGRLASLKNELKDIVSSTARREDADLNVNQAIFTLQKADHLVAAAAEHYVASKFDLLQAQQTVQLKTLQIAESQALTDVVMWGIKESQALAEARDEEQKAAFLDFHSAELEVEATEYAVAQILNAIPSYIVQFEYASQLVEPAKKAVEQYLQYADTARLKWKEEHEKPLLDILKTIAVVVVDCVCKANGLPPLGSIAEGVAIGIESATRGDFNGFARNLSKAAQLAGVDRAIEEFVTSTLTELKVENSPFFRDVTDSVREKISALRKNESKLKDAIKQLNGQVESENQKLKEQVRILKEEFADKRKDLLTQVESISKDAEKQSLLVAAAAHRRFGLTGKIKDLVPTSLAELKFMGKEQANRLKTRVNDLETKIENLAPGAMEITEISKEIDLLKTMQLAFSQAGTWTVESEHVKQFISGRCAMANRLISIEVAKLQLDEAECLVNDPKQLAFFLSEKLKIGRVENELNAVFPKIKAEFERLLEDDLTTYLNKAFPSDAVVRFKERIEKGGERKLSQLRDMFVQDLLDPAKVLAAIDKSQSDFTNGFENGLLALKISFDTSFAKAVENVFPGVEAAKAVNVALAIQEHLETTADKLKVDIDENFAKVKESIEIAIGDGHDELLLALGSAPEPVLPVEVSKKIAEIDVDLEKAQSILRNLLNSKNFKQEIDKNVAGKDADFDAFKANLTKHFRSEIDQAHTALSNAKKSIGVDGFLKGFPLTPVPDVSKAITFTQTVMESISSETASPEQVELESDKIQEELAKSDLDFRKRLKLPVFKAGDNPKVFREELVDKSKSIQKKLPQDGSLAAKLSAGLIEQHIKGIEKRRSDLLANARGKEFLAAGFVTGQRQAQKVVAEIKSEQARVDKGIAETLVRACESRVNARERELKAAQSEYQRCRIEVSRARLEQWLTDQLDGSNNVKRCEDYEAVQRRIWRAARDAAFVAKFYLKLKEPAVPTSMYWRPSDLSSFVSQLKQVQDDARYERLKSYDFNVGAAVVINEDVLRNMGTQLPESSNRPGMWSIRVDVASKRGAQRLSGPYLKRLTPWFNPDDFPDWQRPENSEGLLDSAFARVCAAIRNEKTDPLMMHNNVSKVLEDYSNRKLTNTELAEKLNEGLFGLDTDAAGNRTQDQISASFSKIKALLILLQLDCSVSHELGRSGLTVFAEEGYQVERSVFSQALAVVKLGDNAQREPIYFRHLGNGWLSSPKGADFECIPVRWSPAPLFQLGDPLPWIVPSVKDNPDQESRDAFPELKQLALGNGVVQAARGGILGTTVRFSEKEYLKPSSDNKNFSRFYPLLGTYEIQVDSSMLAGGGELIVFLLGSGMQQAAVEREPFSSGKNGK